MPAENQPRPFITSWLLGVKSGKNQFRQTFDVTFFVPEDVDDGPSECAILANVINRRSRQGEHGFLIPT